MLTRWNAIVAGLAGTAVLLLVPAVASANWTGTYAVTFSNQQAQNDNGNSSDAGNCTNYGVSGAQLPFGYGWPYGTNNDNYTWWAYGNVTPVPSVPGGATVVDAVLSGSVVEVQESGYLGPAGSASIGAGAGPGSPNANGHNPSCQISYSAVDSVSVSVPGNTFQAVPFAIHAYHAAQALVTGCNGWCNAAYDPIFLSGYEGSAPNGAWFQATGPASFQIEYAYTPGTPVVTQVRSGNGTQVTLSWSANGNGGDIAYTLAREAFNSTGVVVQTNPTSGSTLAWNGGTVTASPALSCTAVCTSPGANYTLKFQISVYSCTDRLGGASEQATQAVAASAWSVSSTLTVSGLAPGCYNIYGHSAWFWGSNTVPSYNAGFGYGGWVSPWQSLYTGTSTGFTTTDQNCGYGYVYSVAAVGPSAHTPWVETSEWDEDPCTVSVSAPTTTSIRISWSAVSPTAQYVVIWCVSSNCNQQQTSVGNATAATLTGLTPNTPYTVWVCSTTDTWGYASAAGWTYAAVPSLSAPNDGAGVPFNYQKLAWTANGNPPGTVYQVQQASYTATGQVSYAWIYTGTGTSYNAPQSPGGSYSYAVYAQNAGYGNTLTAPSASVTTQVASLATLTATGTTTATVSWPPVWGMTTVGVSCQEHGATSWTSMGQATGGSTSLGVAGLQPNRQYSCATYAVASNQGYQWWEVTNDAYTDANTPTAVGLGDVSGTSLTARWSGNGNPPGTRYQAVLEYAPDGGAWIQESGWTTSTSWTFSGLTPGTEYEVWVQAESGSEKATPWTLVGQAYTVPAAPANFSAATGGLGWSPTSGRGYVTLSWSPSRGASGYHLWVWNGAAYEQFDVGSATSWDSRTAKIYPTDQSLYPNVNEGSHGTPIFAHNGGGLDLRDRPVNLYCTTGSLNCTTSPAENYWFGVSAYNASGDSAAAAPGYACGQPGACQTPTLPLQTDPAAPVITAWSVNNGGAYTYGPTVQFSLSAAESPSGIAAYALSNDGGTWTTTPVAGCATGQPLPCSGTLSVTGTWTLTPGPGSKTVWAKVESTAGVWSVPQATAVYVNVDQTVPTVNVALDGGAASTSSTTVSVAVSVSDPVADQTGLVWQARYSTDGGQTWSAWQPEGSAMHWSLPWTIPGGASGERAVLVQVQNSDNNLGQGGATIYYVAPGGGVDPGTGDAGRPCQWSVHGATVNATCVTSSQVWVPLAAPALATQMRASLDGVMWGPWQATGSSIAVDLGAAPGAKSIWIQYQDASGNVTAQAPLYYVYDPAGPTIQAGWLGNASATDGSGHVTLNLQATDPVGTAGMTVTVTENGVQVYSGPYSNGIPLTLTGNGYQVVQVAVTNLVGATTTTQLGIYVE